MEVLPAVPVGSSTLGPLALPLSVSLFTFAGGGLPVASKRLFPIYFASHVVGVNGFNRT
jgi:hypothetical protein